MRMYAWTPTLLCCALLAVASACGDDKDDHHGSAEGELTGDCAVISEACHDHDDGEGMLHTCHELAHENDADACTAMKDECVAACEH